jgi:hypothetical protein
MTKFHYLFHFIAYYVAWFSCITLAARGYAWLSSLVVIICVLLQTYWLYIVQHKTRGLWYLVGLVVFFSTLIDSLLICKGVLIYAANPFAPYVTSPWMISVWISFTVILYATLDKLFNYLMLLGLLSLVGFAIAYAVGAQMGAVLLPYGYKTCFVIGSIWLILLPVVVYCYKKIMDIK